MFPEPLRNYQAAHSVMTQHDQVFLIAHAFEVRQVLRYRAHRNQFRAFHPGDGVLIRFPHVDQCHPAQSLLDLRYRDLERQLAG